MEVIKISKTSIVIILTKDDLKKHGIEAPLCATERDLMQIMHGALSPEFFCGAALHVQVFESKEGGCEMFVTKQISEMRGYSREKYIHIPSRPVYCFDNLENLLLACKSLAAVGDAGQSRLFKNESGELFYLETEEEYENLNEFGAVLLGEGAVYYVKEHCTPLFDFAIQKLSALS